MVVVVVVVIVVVVVVVVVVTRGPIQQTIRTCLARFVDLYLAS